MQEKRNTAVSGLVFLAEMFWSEQCAPHGTLTCYSDTDSQRVAFDGITSLICIIDAMCDVKGHAERETAMRTMIKRPLVLPNEPTTAVERKENCKRQSFVVTVYNRQHFSLQGSFKIHDCKVQFRSGIELMKLIIEAMACAENKVPLKK